MAPKLSIGSFARTNVKMGESQSKRFSSSGNDQWSGRDKGRSKGGRRGSADYNSKNRTDRRDFGAGKSYGAGRPDGRRFGAEESGRYGHAGKASQGNAGQQSRQFQNRDDRKAFYRESILAIDVGGTKTHAMLEVNGKLIGELKIGTPKKSPKILIDAITTLASRVGARDITAIGLCVPGFVKDGVAHGLPNLGINEKVEIGKEVSRRLGAPVVVENDSKAFAVAEYAAGAGKGANPLVCITFGTGVGGGAIINGEMYTGALNQSCEFGHLKIALDGNVCGCGAIGCLETFCSGKAIEAEYRKKIDAAVSNPLVAKKEHHLNVHIISQTASAKEILENTEDKIAQEVCKRAAWFAGRGAGNIANMFNPEKLVIGGSVAPHYFEKYSADFKEGFLSSVIPPLRDTPVLLAKFENPSLEGALMLAKSYIKTERESMQRPRRR